MSLTGNFGDAATGATTFRGDDVINLKVAFSVAGGKGFEITPVEAATTPSSDPTLG